MKKCYQLQHRGQIALLLFAPVIVSTAMAAKLPDLPQAFDAGWKGAKTWNPNTLHPSNRI